MSKTADKELDGLDKQAQNRIRAALRELENDPFQPRPKADIKKLHKMSRHQFYRLSIGNYRAIYAVEGTEVKVTKMICS
ncbi:MAG: type II toxin-antitoxin system RelE/ParE family toxin [Candidatus Aenigmarchaeota archaeon]|nr:type II toxin-antitoxin system RelE/ParE family toxin [Candidatus Aenigmarchaeota archaeon]